MKRGWILLLVASLGLNAGLLLGGRGVRGDAAAPGPSRGPAWSGAADAAGGREPDGADWDSLAQRRLGRLAAMLELSPQQRSRLQECRRAAWPGISERRADVRALRRALHEAYHADPIDSARVHDVVAGLALAQGSLDSLVAAALLRELDLLTPAQRAVYLATMPWESGRAHGPGRRTPRGGRSGRP